MRGGEGYINFFGPFGPFLDEYFLTRRSRRENMNWNLGNQNHQF